MTHIADPDAAFDAAFRAHATGSSRPELDCRPEDADDHVFLAALFAACSPLAGLLPSAMIEMQATLKYSAYAATYPHAMRRIALLDGTPIGRIAIDWDGSATHCIDIAVLPEHRARGAGGRLLRAWLKVTDRLGMAAMLTVRADNPVLKTYAALGFVAEPGTTAFDAMIDMRRPVAVRPHDTVVQAPV